MKRTEVLFWVRVGLTLTTWVAVAGIVGLVCAVAAIGSLP